MVFMIFCIVITGKSYDFEQNCIAISVNYTSLFLLVKAMSTAYSYNVLPEQKVPTLYGSHTVWRRALYGDIYDLATSDTLIYGDPIYF